jgi:hypothetical protein
MNDKTAFDGFYAPKRDPSLAVREEVEGEKRFVYGDMLGAGLERVVLPTPAWEKGRGGTTEDMLVRDLGRHVASRVEQAFGAGQFYNGATPEDVLAHFRGAIEGLGLADTATLKQFDKLQAALGTAADPRDYFEREIKPFLLALRPKER